MLLPIFYLIAICSTIALQSRERGLEYLKSLTPAEVANVTIEQFVHSWDAYKKYAWGCDALYPQTKACHNYYKYSLMWTPIDALDTMYLMGLQQEINETLQLLCSTPFHGHNSFTFKTDQTVFVFDYFLRSLGGLLSAYSFINSTCLLNLAIEVSDAIYPIFSEITPSKSGLPWVYINLLTEKVDTSQQSSSPSQAGTHTMEYGIMSVLTGDLKYWNVSMNAMRILYEAKSSSLGLVGAGINLDLTSNIHSQDLWWSQESFIDSGIDSYYEYIVKCWALFNNSECKDWWMNGINSSIIDNFSYYNKNPNTDEDLLWFKRVNMYTGHDEEDWNAYDLYSAFYSGVLSLSTTLIKKNEFPDAQSIIDATIKLAKLNQEANWYMWNLSHIEPYTFNFQSSYNFLNAYNLNPENFESNYYLYMITNESLYYDRALEYLNDLMTYCRCDGIYNSTGTNCVGYSGLTDVVAKARSNSQPSYWFAESLKCMYYCWLENRYRHTLRQSYTKQFSENNLQKVLYLCLKSMVMRVTVFNRSCIYQTKICKFVCIHRSIFDIYEKRTK